MHIITFLLCLFLKPIQSQKREDNKESQQLRHVPIWYNSNILNKEATYMHIIALFASILLFENGLIIKLKKTSNKKCKVSVKHLFSAERFGISSKIETMGIR